MVNKRKRDESSDFDSDEITPGRQILPVANLPRDFDQEPQDGMQYLFLVRRDARRLPHITRVQNPYEMSETKTAHTLSTASTDVLPCEAWRIAFQTHFSNLRKNLTQATIHVDRDHSAPRWRIIPEKKDRDAWWKFLAGYPESAWSPRGRSGAESTDMTPFAADLPVSSENAQGECMERHSAPEATPSHLREIDHRTSIHLVMYFTHWISAHLQNPNDLLTTIPATHGRWIFALLTKIEDRLSADEMNLLRNLARACLGLLQRYRGRQIRKDAVPDGISSAVFAENTARMSDASCWMVFAAVAGHWGQRDLWADAEVTLAGA